ncbi:DUF2795 domain-containing protein, partial [Methanoculleus chikugoensis]|uniref:DUF2795 domain-containing protein n=1 Tax=Methanoculleus chikugoensis TaxID=118126 RepID=UPI001FB56A95
RAIAHDPPGPSAGRLSAAGLQTYLAGMNYPAGRQDLVSHARQHDAPQSVVSVLENFNDRTYRSAADVSAEFGSEARTRQPTGIETPARGGFARLPWRRSVKKHRRPGRYHPAPVSPLRTCRSTSRAWTTRQGGRIS